MTSPNNFLSYFIKIYDQRVCHQKFTKDSFDIIFIANLIQIQQINLIQMIPSQTFKYSDCLFEARLQKPTFFRLRKKEELYLYVSPNYIVINHEPYAKKPQIFLELSPTTHVKWLWQTRRLSSITQAIQHKNQALVGDKKQKSSQKKAKINVENLSIMQKFAIKTKVQLKGFIIETDGFVGEFVGEKVVMDMLKTKFKEIVLQSDFYDEYILGKYLDKGNYAMVYLCTKKATGQQFAVKILEKQRLKSMKNGKESVFNELNILRKLNHPNLLKLFEVFQDRNKYYFIMQFLGGITLFKQIQTRKKKSELDLKPHQIRAIIKQILQGVNYLHNYNIMHRDLKPQNILFQEKGCLEQGDGCQGLKLVDYGLATYQHDKNIIFTKCGTPGFVAPQVITYDERQPIYQVNVDIFSVGVILHILLVGEQAFPGRSRNTILNKNKQCRIDFKAKKYEPIASDGIDLLMRMLDKNPNKRISAKEALKHPFLTKDKPIFKFKKSYKQQPVQSKSMPMQKYLNFQQGKQTQLDKQRKTKGSINQAQQYQDFVDELQQYDPFSYQINQLSSQYSINTFVESTVRDRSQSQYSTNSRKRKQSSLLSRKIISTYGNRQNAIEDKNLVQFFQYAV